jgi:hypothetical protein
MRGRTCIQLNGIEVYFQATTRIAHGVFRIGTEIHQYLMHLGWVREDSAVIMVNVLTNVDRGGQ